MDDIMVSFLQLVVKLCNFKINRYPNQYIQYNV